MGLPVLVIGIGVTVLLLASIPQAKTQALRIGAIVAAILVFFGSLFLSSVRYVDDNAIGVVIKNFGFKSLPAGQIIATDGEMGPQADILPPGWHFGYWPFMYDVQLEQVIEISATELGILRANDGKPLPQGESIAPEWSEENFTRMLVDARYFLTEGGGYKGLQSSVLKPGKYRFNPRLFEVERAPVTEIKQATVAVIKSNVGLASEVRADEDSLLVEQGNRGIWRVPYGPQKLYLNTMAYVPTVVPTDLQTIRYGIGGDGDEGEIEVRTSDGFDFPVDVRVEYHIRPSDAPLVVASFGGHNDTLQRRLSSAVRAIFRNNAERVKALDYVKQRSQQEQAVTLALRQELEPFGISIQSARIGDVGMGDSLRELLETQRAREVAIQEQLTFEEQQRAAEKQKELTRTKQEAEEERRLATATYQVKIAEQDKERRIVEAEAEAEAIRIAAEAQARAYEAVAAQIGPANAALVELLRIVGENNINITPRVMMLPGAPFAGPMATVGMDGGTSQAMPTAALVGTLLDVMISREEVGSPEGGTRPTLPVQPDPGATSNPPIAAKPGANGSASKPTTPASTAGAGTASSPTP